MYVTRNIYKGKSELLSINLVQWKLQISIRSTVDANTLEIELDYVGTIKIVYGKAINAIGLFNVLNKK